MSKRWFKKKKKMDRSEIHVIIIYLCIYISIYLCIYKSISIYLSICMYIYIYIYISIYIYVYIYISIYIYIMQLFYMQVLKNYFEQIERNFQKQSHGKIISVCRCIEYLSMILTKSRENMKIMAEELFSLTIRSQI